MAFYGECSEEARFSFEIHWLDHEVYFFYLLYVLVNYIPSKPFFAKKGLRQGDPVSPFLFALAMEYFSRVLRKVKGGAITFHPKCAKSYIIELLFANDLLVFTQPDIPSLVKLREVIDDFARVSSLHINRS